MRANATVLSASLNLTGRFALPYADIPGASAVQRMYEFFGYQVRPIDYNRDGYPDLAISAPAVSPGRVEVFLGSAQGIANASVWSASGGTGTRFGEAIGVEDFNGDGLDDLAVSEPTRNPPAVSFFFGNGTGLALAPSLTLNWSTVPFGVTMLTGLDLDGDGERELIVGEPGYGATPGGLVHVFWRAAGGLNVSNVTTITRSASQSFGLMLTTLGDTDVDGRPEFAVGWNSGAEVFEGVLSSRSVASRWTFTGSGGFGQAAAGGHDVSGDGVPDLVIGSPHMNGDVGNTTVFRGVGNATYDQSPWQELLPLSGAVAQFGTAVAFVGDVDGDGATDLAVGGHYDLNGAGRMQLYFGGNLTPALSNTVDGPTGQAYGYRIWPLGDLNGDGRADFAVSLQTGITGPVGLGGRVHVYYGTHHAFPENATLSIDGATQWSQVNPLRGRVTVGELESAFQGYLATHQVQADASGFLHVPIDLRFSDGGRLLADGLQVRTTVVLAPDPVSVSSPSVGGSLIVAWTPRGLDADVFSVWSNKTGSWEILANVTEPANSYNDTAVTDGRTYWYFVTEWDSQVPYEGPASQVVWGVPGDLVPPMVPRSVAVEVDGPGHAANLSWLPNVDDTVSYEVWRATAGGGFGLVTTVPGAAALYRDMGLSEETQYTYRVRALDDANLSSPFAADVSILTPDVTPPAAPAGLSATTQGSGTAVNITWLPNTDDTVEYRVHQSPSGIPGSYFEVGVIGAPPFTDVGLTRSRVYYYAVLAVDEAGMRSPLSAAISVTTVDSQPPEAPVLARADPLTAGGTVALEWTAMGDDIHHFSIWVNAGSEWAVRGMATPLSRSFNVTGLTDGVLTLFRISAVDEGSLESAFSNVLSAVPADTEAPLPPPSLQVASAPEGAVLRLTWSPSPSADVGGYRVYCKEPAGATWHSVGSTPPAVRALDVPGLLNGVLYICEVRSVDEVPNESPTGASATATPRDTTPPPVPQVDPVPTKTNRADVSLTGRGEPDGAVEIWRDGVRLGEALVDGGGLFSIMVSLVEGTNNLTLRGVDHNATVEPAYRNSSFTPPLAVVLDRAAPRMVTTSPSDEQQGVDQGAGIRVTFSEALNASSVNISVVTAQGSRVAGTMSYNAATHELGFAPSAPLEANTRYIVQVSARDEAGNELASGVFRFTTVGGGAGLSGSAGLLVGLGIAVAAAAVAVVAARRQKRGRER